MISHVFGDIIYSTHAPTKPDPAEIATLHGRLERARNELPPQLQMRSLEESLLYPRELRVARYGLEVAHLKALCVLYQRYVSMPDHEAERQRCINAAKALIEHQVVLLRAAQPGGELEAGVPFFRQYVHDFNPAAMLLCSHTKRVCADSDSPADNQGLTDVLSSILDPCRLWETSGVNSTKARYALCAIHSFVEQRVMASRLMKGTIAAYNRDPDEHYGPGETDSAGTKNGEMSSTGAFAGSLSATQQTARPAEETVGPYHGTFAGSSVNPDLLFQELFGPNYALQGDRSLTWP